MKIFVKKGNSLKNLGEGRIYSKDELRLNEAFTNGKVSLTLNPNGQDVQASSVQTSAQNMLNQVPQATAVTVHVLITYTSASSLNDLSSKLCCLKVRNRCDDSAKLSLQPKV